MLGLLVGFRLDFPAMGGDGNEPVVPAIIIEPLDKLTLSFGFRVAKGRTWHLRIECRVKLVSPTEPIPAAFAHANDLVRVFLANLGNRV